MFQIGDKIFYPMYGVGLVKGIEEKEVLGLKKLYYTLNIPHIKMSVMVPMEQAANLGIRELVTPDILDQALNNLYNGKTDPNIYENQRYCQELNKKKMKSGDICKNAEIIRDLTRKGQKGKLGSEDSNMLNNARQIFISELTQIKCLTPDRAIAFLDKIISGENETLSNAN